MTLWEAGRVVLTVAHMNTEAQSYGWNESPKDKEEPRIEQTTHQYLLHSFPLALYVQAISVWLSLTLNSYMLPWLFPLIWAGASIPFQPPMLFPWTQLGWSVNFSTYTHVLIVALCLKGLLSSKTQVTFHMLYEVFPNLFHAVLCLMLASLDPVKTLFFLLLSTYNAVLHFSYLGICLSPPLQHVY